MKISLSCFSDGVVMQKMIEKIINKRQHQVSHVYNVNIVKHDEEDKARKGFI